MSSEGPCSDGPPIFSGIQHPELKMLTRKAVNAFLREPGTSHSFGIRLTVPRQLFPAGVTEGIREV